MRSVKPAPSNAELEGSGTTAAKAKPAVPSLLPPPIATQSATCVPAPTDVAKALDIVPVWEPSAVTPNELASPNGPLAIVAVPLAFAP